MWRDDRFLALSSIMNLNSSVDHVGAIAHALKTAILGHPSSQESLAAYWRRLAAEGLGSDVVKSIRLLATLGVPLILEERRDTP